MIDWSVKGRRGWRALLLLSGGLGLATNLAAMGPGGGIERARYATYVAALGGVVSAPVEYAGDMHSNAEIPAFARKYNMPCSACHTAWPELNAFGQRFRDRGYQLGNDRDSPIWVNPSYIPFAIRTTPGWRLERTTNQPVDDGWGARWRRPSPSRASTSRAPTC
jgi:hypothetical protein